MSELKDRETIASNLEAAKLGGAIFITGMVIGGLFMRWLMIGGSIQ
jgi:hypothetical protein